MLSLFSCSALAELEAFYFLYFSVTAFLCILCDGAFSVTALYNLCDGASDTCRPLWKGVFWAGGEGVIFYFFHMILFSFLRPHRRPWSLTEPLSVRVHWHQTEREITPKFLRLNGLGLANRTFANKGTPSHADLVSSSYAHPWRSVWRTLALPCAFLRSLCAHYFL